MRGGALPPALLCAALGFALAFAPRRAVVPALGLLLLAAAGAGLLPFRSEWSDAVFLGAFLSAVLAAASIHLPGGVHMRLALALAVVVGAFAGAVVALAGRPLDLLLTAPLALLCLPGAWLVRRRRGVVLKVAGSWLIAVCLLAASLPLVPTPGYAPDHME